MEKSTRAFILEFAKKLDQNNKVGKLEDSLFRLTVVAYINKIS